MKLSLEEKVLIKQLRQIPDWDVQRITQILMAELENELLVHEAMLMTEPVLRKIWDNSKDAVWDDL